MLEIEVASLRAVEPINIEWEIFIDPLSTQYSWAYNVTKAVQYAEANYMTGGGHAVFGTSPSNCQNFASQCV